MQCVIGALSGVSATDPLSVGTGGSMGTARSHSSETMPANVAMIVRAAIRPTSTGGGCRGIRLAERRRTDFDWVGRWNGEDATSTARMAGLSYLNKNEKGVSCIHCSERSSVRKAREPKFDPYVKKSERRAIW